MRTRILASFCLTSLVAGCGAENDDATGNTPGAPVERISHSQAALMVSANTETALLGLTNAAGFLVESSALAETMNQLGGSSETCTTSAVVCTGDVPCEAPVSECETDEVTTEDLAEARAELEDGVRELVRELSERIFSEANIESADDTSVTYLLGPDDLCDDQGSVTLTAGGETIEENSGPSAECVDEVTRTALRLRVTSPSEGNVDVTVMVTEQRFEPVVFELHQKRLAVTADLEELTQAADVLGGDLEGLESLTGRVQFELVKNAPLDFSARYNVLEEVNVVVVEDGNRLEVSVGASSPTLEARIDGNQKTVSASYGLGPVRVAGPLALFADLFEGSEESADAASLEGDALTAPPAPVEPVEKVYTGMIEAVLGGLDGTLTFDGTSDTWSLANVGLGDQSSTLKHDGNTLLAVDVNANAGRHFDLTLHDTASGLELTFSPTLDVSVLVAFQHVADQFDVPAVLMNDTLRLFFDGQNPSVRGRDNGLEVTSGTLHLTSSAEPEHDVAVSAGMCLLGGTTETSGATTAGSVEGDVAAPVPVEVVEEPVASEEEHPLSVFEVGTCE